MATLAVAPFLLPLVVLVLGALQPVGRTAPTGWELAPLPPTTASLQAAFELEPLLGQTLNSLLVVAVAVPLSVLCASWGGFAIAQLAPRWRRRAVGLAFALLIVPLPGLWVPRFAIFSRLGLVDTYVPLIAPALMGTTPLAVLLFYWSYRRIPRDLFDAARLYGLGPPATWWSVAEPLARPTAFAAAALTFVVTFAAAQRRFLQATRGAGWLGR